jgi:hypothetical protein
MPEYDFPVAATVTGWLYQPFESAARDSATETVGLEASYWKEVLVPLPVLPAASVHVPLTAALTESGPE